MADGDTWWESVKGWFGAEDQEDLRIKTKLVIDESDRYQREFMLQKNFVDAQDAEALYNRARRALLNRDYVEMQDCYKVFSAKKQVWDEKVRNLFYDYPLGHPANEAPLAVKPVPSTVPTNSGQNEHPYMTKEIPVAEPTPIYVPVYSSNTGNTAQVNYLPYLLGAAAVGLVVYVALKQKPKDQPATSTSIAVV